MRNLQLALKTLEKAFRAYILSDYPEEEYGQQSRQ